MIKPICFLILSITTCAVQAQECGDLFIVDVAKLFNHKEKEFEKKVHRVLKDHAIDMKDIDVIHIPLMFVTRKGEKLYRGRKADKEDLVCHLNRKKMQIDESFVFSDTTIIGMISYCFKCPNLKNIE